MASNVSTSVGKSKETSPSKPTIVTDWRAEVFGEVHQGSFVWDDLNITENKGTCSCVGNLCCFRGKPAMLKGSKLSVPRNRSLIEYFNNRLMKFKITPDSPAVHFGAMQSETLTFHELDVLSNALGHALLAQLGPEIKNTNLDNDLMIAVCCSSSVRFVSLVFAIMKMGCGVFPISVDLPLRKTFDSINEVRPILTIVTQESDALQLFQDPAVAQTFHFVVLEDLWDSLDREKFSLEPVPYIKTLESEPNKEYPPLHKRTVAIISPSNAAGVFTGVRYKSQSIFNWLIWEWRYFPFSTDEKSILQSETDTITCLLEILASLLHGNCLVLLNPKEARHPLVLLHKIEQFQIARLTVWPSLLHSILKTVELISIDFGRGLLTSVKYWFCKGGVLNLDEANLFFSLLTEGNRLLVNMYGNDEDIGAVCYQILDSAEHVERLNYHTRLPIGSPIPNVRVYVVNADMKIVRGEEVGEICVAGMQLAEDYTTSEAAPKKFMINPFSTSPDFKCLLKTGDYGRVVRGDFGRRYLVYESSRAFERKVYVESRIVELDEIDMNLRGLVKDCHVMCHRAGHEDQILVAFCCVDNPQALAMIEEGLNVTMPNYMIPDLIQIDELPKFPDGTVNENYLLRYHYEENIRRQEWDDWGSLGDMPRARLHAARVLFQVIFLMLGIPMKEIAINYNRRFFDIPRATYSKLVFVVYELHRNRYPITLAEFIEADSLADIVYQMTISKDVRGMFLLDPEALTIDNSYHIEKLTDVHRDDVLELLCFALTSKGSLDYYSEVKKGDLRRFILAMWVMFSARGLSKIVKRVADHKLVGVMLNINWHDEMSVKNIPLTMAVAYRLQLMQILENGIAETDMSPTKNSVIQVCYAVLDNRQLNHIDTHSLMEKLIGSTIETASELRFDGVIFTTYDYFVTDICVNNFGFKVIRECKLNQFIASDSRRPYHLAPDSLIASLCWRKIV